MHNLNYLIKNGIFSRINNCVRAEEAERGEKRREREGRGSVTSISPVPKPISSSLSALNLSTYLILRLTLWSGINPRQIPTNDSQCLRVQRHKTHTIPTTTFSRHWLKGSYSTRVLGWADNKEHKLVPFYKSIILCLSSITAFLW